MEMVQIWHPILDRTTEVPEQSLEHLFRSGWMRAEDKEFFLEAVEKAKADKIAAKKEELPATPKRSVAKKSEE